MKYFISLYRMPFLYFVPFYVIFISTTSYLTYCKECLNSGATYESFVQPKKNVIRIKLSDWYIWEFNKNMDHSIAGGHFVPEALLSLESAIYVDKKTFLICSFFVNLLHKFTLNYSKRLTFSIPRYRLDKIYLTQLFGTLDISSSSSRNIFAY